MEKAEWGHISKRWIWYTPLCCNQPLSFILRTIIVYPNIKKKKKKKSLLPASYLHPKYSEEFKCAAGSFHLPWSLEQTVLMLLTIFLLNKKNIQMLLILLPWQTTFNRWDLPCTWHIEHQSRLNFISIYYGCCLNEKMLISLKCLTI